MSLTQLIRTLHREVPLLNEASGVWNSVAAGVMRRLNRHALIAEENGTAIFIEEVWDSDEDQRIYRLEYRCTFDAQHALAYCLFNPWSRGNGPHAGVSVCQGHVFANGLLCLGRHHTDCVRRSSMDLLTTVKRARYWCTAFSVLQETGKFPNL